MKRYRVILIIVLILVLLSQSSIVSAQIDYESYADKLSVIGVFKGTGNGYELDREPTRLEGLIMLIRLLGKEDEALAFKADVPAFIDVPSWGERYTNYAYEEGLTKGIGEQKFGSTDKMNAKSYHTFLLRALGYDDSVGDFNWSSASEFIYDKGIVSEQYYNAISTDTFLRDHVAKSSYDTLFSKSKDSDVRLIDSLVTSGDISQTMANQIDPEYVDPFKVIIVELEKGPEYVVIQNTNNKEIDISGWTMVSEKGNQTFVFPEGVILGAMKTCKLTSGGAQGEGDFDMAATTIWNNSSSDPAVLLDADGVEVSRFDN